jgi:hypothetical protein
MTSVIIVQTSCGLARPAPSGGGPASGTNGGGESGGGGAAPSSAALSAVWCAASTIPPPKPVVRVADNGWAAAAGIRLHGSERRRVDGEEDEDGNLAVETGVSERKSRGGANTASAYEP